MRLRHPDASEVHLAYCSNVHAAEDLDGLLDQVARFAGPVRERLGWRRLGLGLWLAIDVARALDADPTLTKQLRTALDAHHVEVVTLNGFPYRAFQAPVVKHAVYRPDWREPERAGYTLALARVLTGLLPDDVGLGSISTLPLGWREGWAAADTDRARRALAAVAGELAALERVTGRRVRVGIEPEPGCIVETAGQAAAVLEGLDVRHLGVCLDACHLAVQFEDADTALGELDRAGVPLVKLQVSAALHAADPRAAAGYDEPRFLHQTRERVGGAVRGTDDLGEALAGGLPGRSPWRVHFHLPVHSGGPATTQGALRTTLAAVVGGPEALTPHLEVETYTWHVLPPDRRPADDAGLVAGLAAELDWTAAALTGLGLQEMT
jgi:sugar phosphate isomerase/epimerase